LWPIFRLRNSYLYIKKITGKSLIPWSTLPPFWTTACPHFSTWWNRLWLEFESSRFDCLCLTLTASRLWPCLVELWILYVGLVSHWTPRFGMRQSSIPTKIKVNQMLTILNEPIEITGWQKAPQICHFRLKIFKRSDECLNGSLTIILKSHIFNFVIFEY